MEIVNNSLKIEYVSIDTIKPYERNAKEHPDWQIEQIINSIKSFGFNDPIAITGDTIVEGHGRHISAQKMGLKEIPIIRLDHLTDAQRKMYTLAHNKLTMNTDFDLETLDFELIDLSEEFNIQDFGFGFEDEDFEVDLPTGDREPIRNMTFTVSDEQHELIEEAIKAAKGFDPEDPAGINENSNGNALYYICEVFKNGLDS